MVDSKVNESALGETGLSVHDKQVPVAVKKTPLRDLQNENNITNQKSMGNPLLLKEDGAGTEDLKVSGTKRPPAESTVSPSHHQSPSTNGSSGHLVYVRRKIETEAVPVSLGKPNSRAGPQETFGLPVTVAITSSDQRRINNQNWEERFLQLQMYLRKLDQSSQEDYLQMLRSLSSAELSRHAVDLEKRAIQLSLEEGKELQRVRALNVLGKSIKNS
ncbi:hypothetical protein Ancab_017216 [Ancistrocladus abbreviatus]